jgi:DNA-directed RNA polymerase alpha subunit
MQLKGDRILEALDSFLASLEDLRTSTESLKGAVRHWMVLSEFPPPAPEEELLLRSVSDLKPSVRLWKCMNRLGIKTLGDLVASSPDKLLVVKNFGISTLNECRQKLADLGLKLRDDHWTESN